MYKFMILFHKPGNLAGFEHDYNSFLGLVEQMPDIRRRQVVDVVGSPKGKAIYYRILEVYFDTEESMQSSLRTQAGQLAGASLARFPAGVIDMLLANVYEED